MHCAADTASRVTQVCQSRLSSIVQAAASTKPCTSVICHLRSYSLPQIHTSTVDVAEMMGWLVRFMRSAMATHSQGRQTLEIGNNAIIIWVKTAHSQY